MSGKVGDLSTAQSEVLEKLKHKVSDVLQPRQLVDDYYMLKWLRARNFDLKKAEAMIRKDVQWRREFGADTIIEDWQPPEVLSKYYVGGVCGFDKEGSPIWVEPAGRLDMRGILHSVKKSDIIKLKVWHCEILRRMMQKQSTKLGKRVEGIVIVADFDKYTLRHIWKPAIDVFTEVLKIFEAHYPESLKFNYCVNVPRFFPVLYNLGKPFISEDTRRKVQLLGNNWKEKLLLYMDADQLPVNWGGTQTDPDGDPYCSSKVCMGGDVPSEYHIHKADLYDLSAFKKIVIRLNTSFEIPFVVKYANSVIQYQFYTERRDIAFGVYKQTTEDDYQRLSQMEVILTSRRANCHMVPEEGTVTCMTPGTYVVVFDNTYSWATPKRLHYLINILPPANMEEPITKTSHLSHFEDSL